MDWDNYFIEIANIVRKKSKDPSSQIGAVIAKRSHEIISTGFNGFPRDIDEKDESRWERPIKYDYVEHAERNAIYNAARIGVSTMGSTLYLVGMGPPCMPCINCCKGIIQAGILKVVGYSYKPIPEETLAKWVPEFSFSNKLLNEAGIEFIEYLDKKNV